MCNGTCPALFLPARLDEVINQSVDTEHNQQGHENVINCPDMADLQQLSTINKFTQL